MAFNKAWCRSDTVHWYLCRCFLSHRACRSRRNAAFVVAERAIIFRTVLSSILPPEAGPDGRSRGERRPPGRRDLPSSRILCVLDTRTSVPHSADTVQILGQIFQRWDSLGCWWGSPRRSRALDSGPTITGGRSRSPSDSRRGLVPVAPPAPRPRREGRACAPQSSDIICNPPAALATDGTPRRGSRARSLHGPRHTSPIAAPPPIERPGLGSHARTVCRPRVGCSRTSPGRPAKKQAPRLVEQPGDLVLIGL